MPRRRTVLGGPRVTHYQARQPRGLPAPLPEPDQKPHAPGMPSQYPKRAKRPVPPVVEYLSRLGYTSQPLAILKFQDDWNEVVAAGMLKGGMLNESNSPDQSTLEAMQFAHSWRKQMPKSWIYYAKKARVING